MACGDEYHAPAFAHLGDSVRCHLQCTYHPGSNPRRLEGREVGADGLLRRNLLIWGLGGVMMPFAGIKLIDLALVALHLTA